MISICLRLCNSKVLRDSFANVDSHSHLKQGLAFLHQREHILTSVERQATWERELHFILFLAAFYDQHLLSSNFKGTYTLSSFPDHLISKDNFDLPRYSASAAVPSKPENLLPLHC